MRIEELADLKVEMQKRAAKLVPQIGAAMHDGSAAFDLVTRTLLEAYLEGYTNAKTRAAMADSLERLGMGRPSGQ